jgi:ribonuclease Z
MGLMGRQREMNLYGPEGIRVLMHDHLKYFGPLPYEINYHFPEDGKEYIYEDDKLTVKAVELMHRTKTYGYLFREKPKLLNIRKEKIQKYGIGIADMVPLKRGEDFTTSDGTVIPNSALTLPPFHPRSYAYISDTRFIPDIAKEVMEVDLLFHEATFSEADRQLAEENWHSTARQAAEFARLVNAGKLLIGHFSTRYRNPEILLDEALKVFPATVAVKDGDRFSLELKREKRNE